MNLNIKEKKSITSKQEIIEIDNRIDEIDKEISALRSKKESLIHKRCSLIETLDITYKLKYEFVEYGNKYEYVNIRRCRFYIDMDDHKEILIECSVFCDEIPGVFLIKKIPEKYKNEFIILWKKAHKEDVEYNKRKAEEHKKRTKDFYKQCYHILAKSVHPDGGGNQEAMQCLNQLKSMWGI